MSRRLDIGVASYGAHDKLKRTLASVLRNSETDWRCFVVDNPGPDPRTRPTLEQFAADEPRVIPVMLDQNKGYAGAVNEIFRRAETEYVAYLDNDVMVHTKGWDEKMCALLDAHHEVGLVFPSNGGSGIAPIRREAYTEVMWGIGFCWTVSRAAMKATGGFDETLGHQEEADYCLRLRMAGWRCALAPGVNVAHEASASTNPASLDRINAGVVRFVNKWVRYFCGEGYDYYSANVLRWEDWPPNALYLEEFYKTLPEFQGLNDEPQQIKVNLGPAADWTYDLLRVPRFKDFYRGRII